MAQIGNSVSCGCVKPGRHTAWWAEVPLCKEKGLLLLVERWCGGTSLSASSITGKEIFQNLCFWNMSIWSSIARKITPLPPTSPLIHHFLRQTAQSHVIDALLWVCVLWGGGGGWGRGSTICWSLSPSQAVAVVLGQRGRLHFPSPCLWDWNIWNGMKTTPTEPISAFHARQTQVLPRSRGVHGNITTSLANSSKLRNRLN